MDRELKKKKLYKRIREGDREKKERQKTLRFNTHLGFEIILWCLFTNESYEGII